MVTRKPIAKVCPVCTNPEDPSVEITVKQVKTGKGKLKKIKHELSHKLEYTKLCDSCEKLSKESVILNCKRCESLGRVQMTFANPDKIREYIPDIEIGQVYDIESCPVCSWNKSFNFTEETEKQKNEDMLNS